MNDMQDAEVVNPLKISTSPIPTSQIDLAQSFGITPGILNTMFDQSQRFPRDLEKVRDKSLFELSIVPDLAARSYYSIPYNQGKKNEVRIEGPGIKAAMTLFRNWQWSLNGEEQVGEDNNAVYIKGMFYDVQMGSYTVRTWRVPKFYKPSGSQGLVRKNGDLLQSHIQAGKSKAVRNAILASLPDWLVHVYYNRAKELVLKPPKNTLAGTQSIQDRILNGKQAIIKRFKVTPKEMEEYLSNNADSIEDDDQLLIHLQGIFNGLKEGQYKVDDVFRGAEEKPKDNIQEPQEEKK